MSKTYIVTGGTGFLGTQLSKKILKDNNVIIFIGKSKNDVSFSERINFLFPEFNDEQIKCIEADLEKIETSSLIEQVYAISKRIDGVWHLAANLSFKESDRQKVFLANLQGVSKMIDLAKKFNSVLYHTSTAYVHGRSSGIVKEEFSTKPKYFNNPYEESKYEAEILIKKANDLKFVIFRPSIMYDSNAEYITNFGYYSFLIALFKFRKKINLKKETKVFIPFPFLYYKHSFLNLMPTDVALDWMYRISKKDEAEGLIFHICNPKPFAVGNVFIETFKAFNIVIPIVGVPVFVAYIYFKFLDIVGLVIKPFRPIAQRIYYFKWYLLKHMYYDMSNTKKVLGFDINEFNFPKNYIYELATSVILKLEVYKKK